MKDYDGPAYTKKSTLDGRKFNRNSNQLNKDNASYRFKPALEEKQAQERGYRPAHHHDQPWRDIVKPIPTPSTPDEVLVATEESEYQVPFLTKRAQAKRQQVNTSRMEERMESQEVEETTPKVYDPSLIIPPTHRMLKDRPQVAPVQRFEQTRITADWARTTAEQVEDAQTEEEIPEQPVVTQAQRDAFHQRTEGTRLSKSYSQSTDESDELNSALSETLKLPTTERLARTAEAQRFQPTRLPKPYQAQTQSVLEVGVSREILQRMVKARNSYLLFEE